MAGDPARLSIEERLREFIKGSAKQPFDWKDRNCGFWVCEWILRERGFDPVAKYRKRFKTVNGFLRFVLHNGGNEAFSRMVAGRAGLVETETPQLGDVGLIYADGATMAIKGDKNNWIAKTPGGVAIGPFECSVAWKL
jgi:Domain of unknown function (DUF6950)